jgi:sugar lactone lactonase YvrE
MQYVSALTSSLSPTFSRVYLHSSIARWEQNGTTSAGGRGWGGEANQLSNPFGLVVDDDDTVIIADLWNDRIVEWKKNATTGRVAVGGNGEGSGMNQLNRPSDVIIDTETNSLIICDRENRRVTKWSRQSGTTSGEVLIDDVYCWGLTMDDQSNLYVTDTENHEVRRFRVGEKTGTVVAGGNGAGSAHNQLNVPTYVFVDREQSLYVSDYQNHRVTKWMKDATEGIIEAGGSGQGPALTQLNYPKGLFVDEEDTIYVAEEGNHRVTRWSKGASQGTAVAGGNGNGRSPNQLSRPEGLCFDRHGNMYVADHRNSRVQRFSILKS